MTRERQDFKKVAKDAQLEAKRQTQLARAASEKAQGEHNKLTAAKQLLNDEKNRSVELRGVQSPTFFEGIGMHNFF